MNNLLNTESNKDGVSLKLPNIEIKREAPLELRLGVVSFFNDCSSEIIARALPLLLTTTLGMSAVFIGFIEGLAETVSIFLRGFSGYLSDKMSSRKPLVVFGYGFSVISRFAMFWAYIPAVLGIIRVLERSGKGLRVAPRDAMLADAAVLGKTGQAFGVARFLDTLGAITGIAIILFLGIGNNGMSISEFQRIVMVSAPFGIIALLVLFFWVPKFSRQVKSKKYISFKIPKEVRGYLLIVFLFSLGNSSDAFLVLRAKELGFSFGHILLIFLLFNVCSAVLIIPITKLSDKVGRFPFLFSGWLVYAVSYFCLGLSTTKTMFFATMLLYGAFYGLTEGIEKALLSDLLPPEKRGVGYGALQVVFGVAALPASLLTGFLMANYGSAIAFSTCGTFALLSALSLGLWRRSGSRSRA